MPETEAISITLNGEARSVPAGLTVAALLAHLGVTPAYVAVELNGDIITRTAYDAVPVPPAAVVELVRFVGGG